MTPRELTREPHHTTEPCLENTADGTMDWKYRLGEESGCVGDLKRHTHPAPHVTDGLVVVVEGSSLLCI